MTLFVKMLYIILAKADVSCMHPGSFLYSYASSTKYVNKIIIKISATCNNFNR